MLTDLLSILPIIITIIIAIKVKDVILAIYVGIFSGILILTNGHLFKALHSFVADYLIVQVTDSYNAGVIILIMFIGGFITLMEFSEGANAFATKVKKYLNTKVKTQMSAYFFGILIFFSDLGTPLILGPVFSPIFDKMKICRAKLAYIIDSTASPMAILVPFTGWGVYIMSLIEAQSTTSDAFNIFVTAIGFQFYSLLALLTVPFVIKFNLDIKAMKNAQNNWEQVQDQTKALKHENGQAKFIIIPLIVLFTVLIGGLIKLGFPFQPLNGSEFRIVLTSAYILSAISLMILLLISQRFKFMEIYRVYIKGMSKTMTMIIVLIGAWSLSAVVDSLHTADVIVSLLNGSVPAFLYPALIFVIAAVLSAATGSSWGTFAILTPFAFGFSDVSQIDPALLMGAVLSGGLFGDHISPISDTTILSATACEISLLDHVKTQLPYGLINAIIAFICFIGAGLYPSYLWIMIGFALALISLFTINYWEKKE